MDTELRTKRLAISIISLIFILLMATIVIPKVYQMATATYNSQHGITAVEEGTVCSKQYIAAHTDTYWVLFSSTTTFYPEKWEIGIRRFNSATSKWATAILAVDKTTYNNLSIGEQYKDPLGRSTYFAFDS